MTRVKICGIMRLEDAQVAAEAGADYIGLVFVPHRHRQLTLPAGQKIVRELKLGRDQYPQVVGLFADQPFAEVNDAIRQCELDLVQLCGAEPLDYCGKVAAPVIKVLHVGTPAAPPLRKGGLGGGSSLDTSLSDLVSRLGQYREAGCLVTLDRLVEGQQGGTGQSFDWSIAAQLSRRGHDFLLAGGLTPDNVAQAIATVHPWGVDVSSGVETDGVKDADKIKEFIRRVHGANTAEH
ncbi:MAG: phosphoribosylanthranilate isomerase [Dehalococcoidia bacterium]|nr:phosphoribosylanthranilate isomerase [Dehalococcoidia bacterium]MSQ17863.1 phosphoribosylanthranilate isomerase [Dehalococcoidia bacterium]